MITPDQARAEMAAAPLKAKDAEGRQKKLLEAVEWAFEEIKKAAQYGEENCRLRCEWPLGGAAYTSRWPREFSKKVENHIRGAGFMVKYHRFLVLCPTLTVYWPEGGDDE